MQRDAAKPRGSNVTGKPEPRIEDGSIQFGSDWPGVFFRGDTAYHFGSHLRAAIERIEKGEPVNGVTLAVLRGLHRELLSASIDVGQDTRQFLKPALQCLMASATTDTGDD